MTKPLKKQPSGERSALALLHQLSAHLTAAGDDLKAVQRRLANCARDVKPPAADIMRALAPLEQAGNIIVHLRNVLDGSSPADSGAGRSYRVCFMNRFARGRNTITACQRSIVIPCAESREAAIEAAKQRFAELEGVPWNLHASFIEAGLLEDDASVGSKSAAE